jgi:hypothetical protein
MMHSSPSFFSPSTELYGVIQRLKDPAPSVIQFSFSLNRILSFARRVIEGIRRGEKKKRIRGGGGWCMGWWAAIAACVHLNHPHLTSFPRPLIFFLSAN